jgi:hypothetical protein
MTVAGQVLELSKLVTRRFSSFGTGKREDATTLHAGAVVFRNRWRARPPRRRPSARLIRCAARGY